MKTCDYCGKDNEDASVCCAGCGTKFEVPEEIVKRVRLPWTLDAKSATVIVLMVIVAAFVLALIGSVIVMLIVGSPSRPVIEAVTFSLIYIFFGVAMVFFSLKLIPEQLKDTSPTGAAWGRGSWEAVFKGAVIGLIIGMSVACFNLMARQFVTHRRMNPLEQGLFTRGPLQIIWIVTVVVLAPPVEEMLFRGILYGGFRKSFGASWAAIITTLLFALGHVSNDNNFLPEIMYFAAGALAMLWCRLRWSAIGPAIALHGSYNLVLSLVALYWTRFR